jgi:hypothetical protein
VEWKIEILIILNGINMKTQNKKFIVTRDIIYNGMRIIDNEGKKGIIIL